jgi:hypothetical protein
MYSNVKSSVEVQEFLFNTFWNKAILAEERITEIEEGLKPAFMETLSDADEIQNIGIDLVRSAKEDKLILFSRKQKAGLIHLLKHVASQSDVKIRILTHINRRTSEILDSLKSIKNVSRGSIKNLSITSISGLSKSLCKLDLRS